MKNLPDAFNELKEDWAPLIVTVLVTSVTDPLTKLVTKAQPLLLYQHLRGGENPLLETYLKSVESAKVRIEKDHGKTGQLGCPIPPIAAVNQH